LTGEIAAYVWGKRNLKTARRLREELRTLGIRFDRVCTDAWESFLVAFKADNLVIEKKNTVGIEGNNCRLRHRIVFAGLSVKPVASQRSCLIISKLLIWLFLHQFWLCLATHTL
jgi:IS1 family transposase